MSAIRDPLVWWDEEARNYSEYERQFQEELEFYYGEASKGVWTNALVITHLNTLSGLFANPSESQEQLPPALSQHGGGPVGPYCVQKVNGQCILADSKSGTGVWFM